jgi:tetratricopeptide (TPR) repeat protein
MVTRTRAFSADSFHGLMLQKLGDGPARPDRRADRLPRAWEAAILRALAPDPRDRFASAEALMTALADERRSWTRLLRLHAIMPAYLPRRWRFAAYSGIAAVALTGAVSVTAPGFEQPSLSVAIRPFENLTGRAEDNYLAVGTASQLGHRLSAVEDWRVIVAKDPLAPVEPARAAQYELTGHVEIVEQTLRLTVELTDMRSGALVWSRSFEGARKDALKIEDQLAVETFVAFREEASKRAKRGPLSRFNLWSLWGHPPEELRTQGTSNSGAFDDFIRARYLSEDGTLPSTLAAMALYRRAIALDPGFARAYAGLADVHSGLMNVHHAKHDALLAERERYAMQAVAVDPNLAEAQLALAAVRQMQARWDEAEQAFKRALDLHPRLSRAYRSYGGMLVQFGRYDEGLRLGRRGLELDPYDVPGHSAYGLMLFYSGRDTEAAAHLEKLIAQHDHQNAHFVLGQVYAHLGGTATIDRGNYLNRALREAERLRQYHNEAADRHANFVVALALSYQGDTTAAQPFLEPLERGWSDDSVSPSFAARIYAVQRRTGEALDALEAAEAQHDRELMYVAVSPLYDAIRDEPRFRALIKRAQLTQ